jgi:hypothetical protein
MPRSGSLTVPPVASIISIVTGSAHSIRHMVLRGRTK